MCFPAIRRRSCSATARPPAQLAAFRHSAGLDLPIAVQYLHWLGRLLHGQLGQSLVNGFPVAQLIAQRIPVAVELTRGREPGGTAAGGAGGDRRGRASGRRARPRHRPVQRDGDRGAGVLARAAAADRDRHQARLAAGQRLCRVFGRSAEEPAGHAAALPDAWRRQRRGARALSRNRYRRDDPAGLRGGGAGEGPVRRRTSCFGT